MPSHDGWPAQREALRWFVEQGRDKIYALDTKPIRVRACRDDDYYILGGHHRSLALYILGDDAVIASREIGWRDVAAPRHVLVGANQQELVLDDFGKHRQQKSRHV